MNFVPHQAIIALGSNLGDRYGKIQAALALLEETPGIHAVLPSPVYETAPVGDVNQPRFLNLVAGVETALSPEDLMARLLEVERELGRRRDTRWGPRTIDLDLLFYENEERTGPGLTLPHPRWRERTFVTIPLRALLLRETSFAGETWDDLRAESRAAGDDPEVKLWQPPR